MKKIFITILLVLIPLNVQAINNQKTFSETKLCKYYKETKVFTDYTIEKENPKEYPFKSNEQIIKEYETETKPEEKTNRIIKEETYNNYRKIKNIQRVVLRFIGEPLLYQLEIYEKDQKLEYTFSKNNPKKYESIKDNNFKYFERILLSSLDLELDHEVNPFDITIKLYISKENNFNMYTYLYPKEMTEKYEQENPLHENYYIKNTTNISFETIDNEMEIKTIKISEQDIKTYRYDDEEITTQDELDKNIYHKISTTTKYKYQDTLFKYYKIEKEYQEGYYKTLEGYIKDETKCINPFSEQKNNTLEKIPVTKKLQTNIKTKYKEEKTNTNATNKEEKIDTNTKETTNTSDPLVYKSQTDTKKENNLSYKESKKKTKTNKIIYILPVIILSIIFLLGYLLYNLLKER